MQETNIFSVNSRNMIICIILIGCEKLCAQSVLFYLIHYLVSKISVFEAYEFAPFKFNAFEFNF